MLFIDSVPILPVLKTEQIEFKEKRIPEGLNLLIVNLMPVKQDAERQLLRLLGLTSYAINVDFI
ncbi:MAG: homoserine O-succinyltransferase, partial [Staphylococcus simulans]|nr:homoserine O-succinyltransferase [Staphylococcus simulans]